MQQLLNPFAQKYPESNEVVLHSNAACIRFNSTGPFAGHYIAAGNYDGSVDIWDVESRGVVRELRGHVKPVSSVCWSRNNRYLLSASLDSTCIIWDLSILRSPSYLPHSPLTTCSPHAGPSTPESPSKGSAGQRVQTVRFDAPIAHAVFHPQTSKVLLVTLACNEVVLVDLRNGAGGNRNGRRKEVLMDVMEGQDELMGDQGEEGPAGEEPLCSAIFSPCGSRIYAGTTRGKVLIIDPVSRFVQSRVHVANSAIRQLSFDPSGQHLITSATDRALRLLSCSPLTGLLTPSLRFQDSVNRTPWHAIGFSGDAEYVMGGAAHKAAHNVFVWDRESGVLVKVLEGPRDSLGDCHWHPTRPIIASTTTSGDIALWQTSTPDNWAAFAPGFEELEENVEYDEREDEFDIEDEGEFNRRKDLEEDLDIDILAFDDSYPRSSDPPIPAVQYVLDAYALASTSSSGSGASTTLEEAGHTRMQQAIAAVAALPPAALGIPAGQAILDEQGLETELGRAVRGAVEAYLWAVGSGQGAGGLQGDGGDGDDWEGFYLSLEVEPVEEEEE